MAAKLKLVERAPANVLTPMRGGRKSNKALGRDRKHLTPSEVERLEQVVKRNRNGNRDWLMIHMAARHGLRASELVRLKRSAIDVDRGRLQVARLKGGMSAVHPLDADTMRGLRRLYRETGERDYVFVSERGGPMAREGFQRLVERAGQAAGCRPSPHAPSCLRLSAGQGKDAFAIQGWLGHQSLTMTKGYCALAADRFKDW